MPDTIFFEELAEAAPQTITSSGEFLLTGAAFVDLPESGLFGYGEFPVTFETNALELDTLQFLVGYGEFDLSMAFSLIPETLLVTVYGELPLYGLATTDLLLGRGDLQVFMSGVISTAGAPIDAFGEEMLESFLFTDGAEASEVAALVASLMANAGLTATGRFNVALTQTLLVNSQLRVVLQEVLTDNMLVDAVLAGDRQVIVALVDALRMRDMPLVDAIASLSDGVALADLLVRVVEDELEDTAAMADELEAKATLLESIIVNALLADELVPMATVTVLVAEDLEFDAALTSASALLAAIEEAVEFGVNLSIDGLPYFAMAMNTATKGVTEYTNYEFTGLTEFNGTVYGVDGTGLYRMEGDDDAGTPIAASLRTALLRIGAGKEVRIDSAYLGYRSDGTLQMKVVYVDARGSKRGQVYDLQELPARDQRPGRIKVGKGLKAVYWAFELSNSDGADFDLDVLEILPLVTARRVF